MPPARLGAPSRVSLRTRHQLGTCHTRYVSADVLLQSSIEDRALSALSAGLELPLAADATDETLTVGTPTLTPGLWP